jgi:hypothetical protein
MGRGGLEPSPRGALAPVIVTIIFVVGGIALAAFLLFSVRGTRNATGKLEDVGTFTRPVDLLAFQNLTDPKEEEFLRSKLPREVFQSVQRERMRAVLEYVERTAWNASVLLRVGESLRHEEPALAAMGRDLANAALRLRVTALLAIAVLHLRIRLPGVHISVQPLADGYEGLRRQFARVARVQRPAEVTHLLAAL